MAYTKQNMTTDCMLIQGLQVKHYDNTTAKLQHGNKAAADLELLTTTYNIKWEHQQHDWSKHQS